MPAVKPITVDIAAISVTMPGRSLGRPSQGGPVGTDLVGEPARRWAHARRARIGTTVVAAVFSVGPATGRGALSLRRAT